MKMILISNVYKCKFNKIYSFDFIFFIFFYIMQRKNIKKIKWDKNNIINHDKLRGTRMKINEIKTPKNNLNPPSQKDQD